MSGPIAFTFCFEVMGLTRTLHPQQLLKHRILWGAPAVFLVWTAIALANCTLGWALVWILVAWLTCAYLVKYVSAVV